MFLEYKIMNYSGKVRIKNSWYDSENGKIAINKVRLYYFFSR